MYEKITTGLTLDNEAYAGPLGHAASWTFGHNGVGQLTSADYVGDAPLWWQAAANRTDNYSVNGLNQYTTVNGTSIAHDGNGNLTTDASGRQFTYDAENVLRQALSASGSQIADYKYFADGTRRRKITPSTTTDYWYWGDQEILEVANQDYTNPDVARRYVRMPGSVDGQMGVGPHLTNCSTRELGPHPQFSLVELLMIDYTGAGCASGCEVWAHQDRLGSTVMTTDETGAVLDSFTYSPYGESGESTTGFPFRFTGQKLDPETGLYYYKARYYDPNTGRFLQTDPIGYEDQMNLYAYVGNDPLNATDPTGMFRDTKTEERLLRAATISQLDSPALPVADLIAVVYLVTAHAADVAYNAGLERGRIEYLNNLNATRLDGDRIRSDRMDAAEGINRNNNILPKVTYGADGALTNGKYTVNKDLMRPHATGDMSSGKSQFLNSLVGLPIEAATLDAAAIADANNLWDAQNKASVKFNQNIGVHGRTGELTDVINVYRRNNGQVHSSPGTPSSSNEDE